MVSTLLPKSTEHDIRDALRQVGYGDSLVDHNVEFNFIGSSSPYYDPAPLVAFCARPFDQLTSAIGVKYLASSEYSDKHVDALGKYLWVPYSIVARPEYCEIWQTLPTNGTREPTLLENEVSYNELTYKLKSHRDSVKPEQVRERKLRWRQMSLYEIGQEPNTFFDWAFSPTRDQLSKLLKRALEEGLHDHLDIQTKVQRLRWLLRFIGVRIAWDKGLLKCQSRSSASELVQAATKYPVPLQPISQSYDLAEKFINTINDSINLRMADGGLLSQILQTNGLIKDLRSEWKLYPTPPDIAWRMIDSIPIEAVPEEDRLIWDGTCGTGTLMVVGMEKLRLLSPSYYEEPGRLSKSLMGSDREPLLADLSRMTLDTALGKFEGRNWQIDTADVLDYTLSSFSRRPSIIVGNPPFEAKGRRPDLAIDVIEKYIEILKPGGMLAVVLPRSILGATNKKAVDLRQKLIQNFEIYELWELPQGFAANVSSDAAIICGRKRYSHEIRRSAVVWKIIEPHRIMPPLTDIVPSPDVWLKSKYKAIENPLMLRLRDHFNRLPILSDVISRNAITEGITTGAAGNADILSKRDDGTPPFLRGRSDMEPFYIPWNQRPKWIRYNSTKLLRPRRKHESAFRHRKVLITRWSTGGSPWATQAAIDEQGLYPSDDFISISPEPMLSCELIAGLFNSALINVWIRLANPSRTIRVDECASIPVPKIWPEQELQKLRKIVLELSSLRSQIVEGRGSTKIISQKLEEKTLDLDELVYDIYGISRELRSEVNIYLNIHGKSRPGFDKPLIKHDKFETFKAITVFSNDDSGKMKALLETRKQRELNQLEARELEDLVSRWEKAQIVSNAAALRKEHPEFALSLASLSTDAGAL